MKQNASLALILSLFFSCLALSSCTKCEQKTCSSSKAEIYRSINKFDYNSSSVYFNQVVVNYKFTQTTTTYTAPNECSICPNTISSVKLILTNTTSKTITFDYNISFTLNSVSWNYQNAVTIAPYGTNDVGQISDKAANISLGQFNIESVNISYQ